MFCKDIENIIYTYATQMKYNEVLCELTEYSM